MKSLLEEHENYFERDILFKKSNFKKNLTSKDLLTRQEINEAIFFHNNAMKTEVYGAGRAFSLRGLFAFTTD